MARYLCCTRCKNQISTANWTRHESSCFNLGTHKAWNAGLTLESNPDLADKLRAGGVSLASKVQNGFVPAVAMYWQDEKNRKKKSEWRKQLHKDYPETHPNRRLAGNRNRMSFPERLVFDYLTELNIKFDHQKKVEGFYPDFVIGQLIIEVDGERWHCRKKDNDRDQVLTEAGFRVVRFPVGKQKDLIKRVDEFLTKEKLK